MLFARDSGVYGLNGRQAIDLGSAYGMDKIWKTRHGTGVPAGNLPAESMPAFNLC